MERTRLAERTRQGQFCWTDLAAMDLEEQTRFYEAVFGWTHRDLPTDRGPVYRQFLLDDMIVAGAAQMADELESSGRPSTWNTYIAVTDVNEIALRAEDLGGRIAMPPMDVMHEGRMLGVKDPSGATVFFWQPGNLRGAELFGTAGSLVWCDLNTREPLAAAEFFRGLLPWEVHLDVGAQQQYWQILVEGEAEGGIMPITAQLPDEVRPHWLVYFGSNDTSATMDRIREFGGSTEMTPMKVGERCMFCVASDPAGALFAVMEPLLQA